MKGSRKGLYLVCLILASVLMMSGCGSRERQIGIDGYVYVPEEELLLPANQSYEKLVSRGGHLYYQVGNSAVDRVWLEEGSADSTGFSRISSSDGSILSFAVDEDMAVYYLQAKVKYSGTGYLQIVDASDVYLVKQLADGSQAYRVALEDFSAESESITLEVNQEKQAFVLAGIDLYAADADGELLEGASLEEYGINSPRFAKLLEGEEGKVYFHNGGRVYSLYEVIAEGGSVRLAAVNGINWPSASSGCELYGSPYGLLCNESMSRLLYRYHEEDTSWHELLRWGDSDEKGSVISMTQVSEDRLAVSSSDDGGVRIFTKTAVSELPEKKVLVMVKVGYYASYELEPFIVEFNRNSTEYHVIVETYGRDQDSMARLDARLLSSDPPDLLIVDEMDIVKYAQKQLLEDLTPYLEASAVLDGEDYLEKALESYTISGRLIAIPDHFILESLYGRKKEVGEKEGWTVEDVMALADEYPQYHFMWMDSLEYVYPFFADYVFDRYIDWESGSCNFDSDSFREFVKWMEKHTEGIEIDYDRRYTEDEVLLGGGSMHDIYNGQIFYYCNDIFECETMIMGYPSGDGGMSFSVDTWDTLAIVSKSQNKKGAWEFIEKYLSREVEYTGAYAGFPTNRNHLERYLEAERDDGTGMKANLDLKDGRIEWNGTTEEEMELLLKYIEAADFTLRGGIRDAVSSIVMEEMAVYLNGEKPLEEVSRIIQNRVINLVQENM